MADHFQEIYASHADQYDRLVSCEDYQGNILRALMRIRALDGLEMVEMGAGTGRLTRLLAPLARTIRAYDVSLHMLNLASVRLKALGLANYQLAVGEHCRLPSKNASANLVIEGWSFGHLVRWYPQTWREEIEEVLCEVKRVLRPGGTVIIIETLGTGTEMPHPPSSELEAFYSWLEEYGFAAKWISTDYRFASLIEAEELTRFFFGEALADRVVKEKRIILPECTGIWWLTV